MLTHNQRRAVKRTFKIMSERFPGPHCRCDRNQQIRQAIEANAEDGTVMVVACWRDPEGPVMWFDEVPATVTHVKDRVARYHEEAEGRMTWELARVSEFAAADAA
jgi:hypothetical protein